MKHLLFITAISLLALNVQPQNVGIGTTTPQTTLDVKGNQRIGGVNSYIAFDSLSGKIDWRNANLFVPVSQRLIQHSAAADGLFYNNTAPVIGQLEYRNASGNPVFYTNFMNGNGYFKGKLGISVINPLAGLHVGDSSVLFTAPSTLPGSPGIPPVSGPGNRMMWYADKASFRAGSVALSNWDKDSIGINSFASGYDTKASGTYSTATGYGSTASQGYSTAMGFFSKASGSASTALGNQTTAKAFGSLSIGSLNDNSDNPDPLNINASDRIFQIGNGFGFSPGNAMTVLRNGNTGMGPVVPLARLHVTDSNVLFSAVGDIPASPGNVPITGQGRRMMWFADKAAFRAGYVNANQWSQSNIGYYSFATGYGTKASGDFSASMGNSTTASGSHSTSMGASTTASGSYSTSMGYLTTASGSYSTSMGFNTTASGYYSTSMGYYLTAKAMGSLSIGVFNDNTDNPDLLFEAPTDRIFQIGNGSISGNSNAVTVLRNGNTGIGMVDPAFLLDVGARMRIRSTSGLSAGLWLNNDANNASPAFIGMRTDNEVGFYGQTGTFGWRFYVNTSDGNAWLQGTLTQNSDARLKKDILPLQNPLQKIIQLNGYTYHWKDEQLDKSLQTGMLAQEVQKMFPELVKENKDGVLAVNYAGLIPVLIESVKEQQQIIERQQKQIDDLKKMFERSLKQ